MKTQFEALEENHVDEVVLQPLSGHLLAESQ